MIGDISRDCAWVRLVGAESRYHAREADCRRIMHDRLEASRDRLLRFALIFTVIAHGVAMGGMAILLLPGVPGGSEPDVVERARYVAENPWLWRLGWLPWQATAVSDVLVGVALLRVRWVPRSAAVFAFAATLLGACFDQTGEFLWTWRGVDEATRAASTGDAASYARFEADVFRLTAGYGPIGYVAGAAGWSWCFAAARVGSQRLMWFGIVTWALFVIGTLPMFLPATLGEQAKFIVSAANAVAFLMLMVWLSGITESVFRRGETASVFGNLAPWRHPSPVVIARPLEVIANSRVLSATGRRIPALAMASDIATVVYINYLVEADRLEPLVRRPLALQRLGPEGRHALFTFLVFRHGHFGPECFGPLRFLWPSPIQSNWRIHVLNPSTGRRGIQFLSTTLTSTPHALIARLLVDDVPMHIPRTATFHCAGQTTVEFRIDPGKGSAPGARATLRSSREPILESPWSLCFASWRDMIEYCVPQDRALTVNHTGTQVIRQDIELNIPLDSCMPLAGAVLSETARRIAGDAVPLCFAAGPVKFRLKRPKPDVVTSGSSVATAR